MRFNLEENTDLTPCSHFNMPKETNVKRIAFLIAFLLLIASPPAQASDATRQESAQALECDRRCAATVGKAYFALERLRNEAEDLILLFDEDAVPAFVKAKGLKYIVGPYYGWRGCDKGCGVLVRLSKHEGRWVIEGSALKGTQPEPGAHYVYRMYVTGGKDLPATVKRDIVDADNGDPLQWNSHPAGDFATGQCYVESVISTEVSKTGRPVFRIPKGMPCGKLTGK